MDTANARRLHKRAITGVARLTRVDLREAINVRIKSPILNEEVHIEEQLTNLEESLKTYRMAIPTFQEYPDMKPHLYQEKRLILKHCLGQIVRMLLNKPLPREYTMQDITEAITRLVRIIVEDIRRTGYDFDAETKRIFEPFLGAKLKVMLWEHPMSRIIGYQAKFSPVRVMIDRY